MKTIAFVICLLGMALTTYAQQPRAIRAQPVMDPQFYTVQEWISPKETNRQTIYLNDAWNKGTIYLKNNQVIKGYKLNYDLENDIIEIETKDGIKLLPGNRVKQFKLLQGKDSVSYVNGDSYTLGNIYNIGFYEVVNDGPKMQVFKKTDLEIMKANFNAITNTGYKTDKITKKNKLYLAEKNKVTLIKGNSFDIFGSKAATIEKYAKENKLKLKNPEDLAKLVAYFNSI